MEAKQKEAPEILSLPCWSITFPSNQRNTEYVCARWLKHLTETFINTERRRYWKLTETEEGINMIRQTAVGRVSNESTATAVTVKHKHTPANPRGCTNSLIIETSRGRARTETSDTRWHIFPPADSVAAVFTGRMKGKGPSWVCVCSKPPFCDSLSNPHCVVFDAVFCVVVVVVMNKRLLSLVPESCWSCYTVYVFKTKDKVHRKDFTAVTWNIYVVLIWNLMVTQQFLVLFLSLLLSSPLIPPPSFSYLSSLPHFSVWFCQRFSSS